MEIRVTVLALAAAASLVFGGCSAPEDESSTDDPAQSSDAVVGGSETFANPAVGVTTLNGQTGCSATLVAPNVILTAGHCFSAGRTDIAPWQFEIRKSARESYRYDTGEGIVLSRGGAGPDDVALLRLTQSVPSAVATPIPIATGWPSYGTKISLMGFGCTNRTTGEGAGTKRVASFRYNVTWDLGWVSSGTCPGDSGGALLGANGPQVLGVLSGYRTGSGLDLFGDAVKHRATLQAQIAAWR